MAKGIEPGATVRYKRQLFKVVRYVPEGDVYEVEGGMTLPQSGTARADGVSPEDVKAALEAEGWSKSEVEEALRRFTAMQKQGRQGRPDAGKVVVERRGGEERREFDSKEEAARFIQREGDNNRLWKYARSDLSQKEQEEERAFLEKYKGLKKSEKADAIVTKCADLQRRLDAVCAERVAMHRGKDGGPRSEAGAVRGDEDKTWHVQVFETDTKHLKDVNVQASSKEEAVKKVRRQVPGGKKFYAEPL